MAKNVKEMTMREMVEEYNATAEKPVKKFADRKTAEKRLSQLRKTAQPVQTETAGNRSLGAARSWKDEKVRAARSQRNGVKVDGEEYRSVRAAFVELGLPLENHIRFRKMLKESGKEKFRGHSFTLIA